MSTVIPTPSTPFHQVTTPDQAIKAFVKEVAQFSRQKRPHKVFDDWCEAAYCAIAKTATPDAARQQALEDQYMALVRTYHDPNDFRRMANLTAYAQIGLKDGGTDLLGRIAGELGALDGGIGQFFTPHDISTLMVHMTAPDFRSAIAEHGHVACHEPAAGAGGMIIAAADQCVAQGCSLDDVWFDAWELVPDTYRMCYVQLALRGVAAKVVCGNTLTCEIVETAFTPAAYRFHHKHKSDSANRAIADGLSAYQRLYGDGRAA